MKEYFDPYTFDWKSYVKETYDLNEMPSKLSHMNLDVDAIDNSYYAKEVEQKYKQTGTFKHGNENLRVFEYDEGGRHWTSLLSENKPLLAMEHTYTRINNPIKGMVNLHIWHFKWYHALISRWFDERIIPNEPVIISDKAQTEKGFNFWKRMFQEYGDNKKTHKMYVIDFKTGQAIKDLKSVEEMEKYYQSQDAGNLRFILQKL